MTQKGFSYKDAGVDIDAGNALVEAIKPLAKQTIRPGAAAQLGGFGALFDMAAIGYTDPLLVATTDGVGTKLKIAMHANRHDTIGIDLVAMCVNDLVVQGAEPLFFLDYFATGALELETAKAVIAGIAEGCKQSGCALIGGETAEMPGMYKDGEYDLAGFSVGVVERSKVLPRTDVTPGDIVLGLASSGVHSNGYSLVRHIVTKQNLSYDAQAPFASEETLGSALLKPTRIYVKSCLAAIRTGAVKAAAHITGGGLLENIPRVLPKEAAVELDCKAFSLPPLFTWLAAQGNLAFEEMVRTFNCGIGMVLVVEKTEADKVIKALEAEGEQVKQLGRIVERAEENVIFLHPEVWGL